jgi:hypothetical protein
MKHLISILAITVFTCGVLQAQQTQKLTAGKHNEYGLIYSLPVTHLDIEVEAVKTIKKAGPYSKYAKKFLGTDNAIIEDSEEWTLKDITVSPYGAPDTENQYLMQFKSGSTPFIILNKAGLPLSINIEEQETNKSEKEPIKKGPSALENNASTKVMSGELLVSESTAKKAEIAANQIYKIRESRTNLITGEAEQMPPDGQSMKMIIEQLDAQEAALTALFLGTTQTESKIMNFDYIPVNDVENEVVFRLSDFNGVVDRNNLSGDPVYLSLKITEQGELPVNEKGETKKLPKGAVMYKIPGKATVTLKYNGKTISSNIFDIAQFGIDFGLDPAMFTDKKQPSYLKFYPETGAIKEIGTVNLQ